MIYNSTLFNWDLMLESKIEMKAPIEDKLIEKLTNKQN